MLRVSPSAVEPVCSCSQPDHLRCLAQGDRGVFLCILCSSPWGAGCRQTLSRLDDELAEFSTNKHQPSQYQECESVSFAGWTIVVFAGFTLLAGGIFKFRNFASELAKDPPLAKGHASFLAWCQGQSWTGNCCRTGTSMPRRRNENPRSKGLCHLLRATEVISLQEQGLVNAFCLACCLRRGGATTFYQRTPAWAED